MPNKIFDKIKKTMAISLALCFLLSVAVASVNAATFEQNNNPSGNSNNYRQGYEDGLEKGRIDAKKDCSQYGRENTLTKIPTPSNNEKSYIEGFTKGYLTSYNEERYTCLKNG